jgi:hypothetical protein
MDNHDHGNDGERCCGRWGAFLVLEHSGDVGVFCSHS